MIRRTVLFAPLLCLLAFAALAVGVAMDGALVRFDKEQTARLHHFTAGSSALREVVEFITDLGAGRPLTVFSIFVVGVTFVLGRPQLAALCAVVMALNGLSIPLLKDAFARPRPEFVTWPMNASFPSGHAQGSLVVYGLTIWIVLSISARRWRWVAAAGLAMLIVLIGLSRLMLGVHYFSDVLGGFLIGMTWIGMAIIVSRHLRSSAA